MSIQKTKKLRSESVASLRKSLFRKHIPLQAIFLMVAVAGLLLALIPFSLMRGLSERRDLQNAYQQLGLAVLAGAVFGVCVGLWSGARSWPSGSRAVVGWCVGGSTGAACAAALCLPVSIWLAPAGVLVLVGVPIFSRLLARRSTLSQPSEI